MFGVKKITKKEGNVCSSQYDNMTDEIKTTDNLPCVKFNKHNKNINNINKKSINLFNNGEKMLSQPNNCSKSNNSYLITTNGVNNEDSDTKVFYNSSKQEFALANSYKISTKSYPVIDNHHNHYHHHHHHHHHSHNSNHSHHHNHQTVEGNSIQGQSMDIIDRKQEEEEVEDQNSNLESLSGSNHNQSAKNYSTNDDDDGDQGRKVENSEDDDNNGNNYLSDDNNEMTTDSEFSDISGLSDISGQDWKPMAKPLNWVQKQINSGANPREILSQILSNDTIISSNINDMALWRILADILSEPPRRQKLHHINTIADVVHLLRKSSNIIVLTGAGVSVSCGIPDFRSHNGIYNRLAKDFPDLPDPQAMFDINYFSKDPRPFFKFAREIYPGQFKPSPCHRFIKLLEKKNKLLRNYTQNIDTLEQVAGIQNVIECHGSFATASCTKCKFKTNADAIRDDIFAQRIPKCPKCNSRNYHYYNENSNNSNSDEYCNINSRSIETNSSPSASSVSLPLEKIVQGGIMKPDIVFFGEGLPEAFHTAMASDKDKCDLLIVIGSSLKVRPVALIPNSIPPDVPQILINREQLNHLEFDVELLGDSDIIINHLCHLLGESWEDVCWNTNILTESKHLKPKLSKEEEREILTINDHHIKPENITATIPLDPDTADSSSKSASTLTDGSNSPFCDSGFDSSSSHQTIIDGSSSSNKNHQLLKQQQQIQLHQQEQLSITKQPSFNNANDKQSIDTVKLSSSSFTSSFSSTSLQNDNVQIENSSSNTSSSFLNKPRRLSIDSSKDSGICDSANIIPISTCEILNVDDEEEEEEDNDNKNRQHHYDNKSIENTIENNTQKVWSNNKAKISPKSLPSISPQSTSSSSSSSLFMLSRSIADRLYENTYYHHPLKNSYVFPGAQVFWNSDSEDEDDDEEDNDDGEGDNRNENDSNNNDDDDDDDDNDDNEEDNANNSKNDIDIESDSEIEVTYSYMTYEPNVDDDEENKKSDTDDSDDDDYDVPPSKRRKE